MVDTRTFLDMVEAYSLSKESPIKIIWETYQIGVNVPKVDCPPKDQECFIERINKDNVNKDNVITMAVDKLSVNNYYIYCKISFVIFFPLNINS